MHEIGWTATARHADIVLPCTMTLERNDIGATQVDPLMVAMKQAAEPYGEARDDYAIFSALAERAGHGEAFTEGRTPEQWLRHLYRTTQEALAAQGLDAPDFDTFWERGELLLPQLAHDGGPLRAFRNDPDANPLSTPSGKVEIFSETIAGFGYADCPGHPAWIPPVDVVDENHPLQLVANQPATRLHSQFDFGGHSTEMKHRGREVGADAPARRSQARHRRRRHHQAVQRARRCLAAVRLSDQLREGVVQCRPRVVRPAGPERGQAAVRPRQSQCADARRRHLQSAQGCCGQLTAVQVERFTGNLPPIRRSTRRRTPPRSQSPRWRERSLQQS